MAVDPVRNGKRAKVQGAVAADRDVVFGGVSEGDVEVVLDRALKRESRYFRLTDGQRKALGLKRAK